MELKGHSGCKLYIVEDNNIKMVKKVSKSLEYNDRLIKQMNKQKKSSIKGFEKCNVYEAGYEGDLFYFVMEYVNGNTVADHINNIRLEELIDYTNRFAGIITEFCYKNVQANLVFKKKINTLALSEEQKKKNCVLNALRLLNEFSWEYVIPSECHGDLTLENIVIQNNNLFLLDYLDSFYDSWIIDYAKLFQDVETMWSFRGYEHISSNTIIRLTVMRDVLIEHLLNQNKGEELLETVYHTLLLNLLRIYPYCTDKHTEQFLDEKINYVIHKIDNKGWRV